MENLIEISGLTKHYRDFSLEDVSFTMPKGYVMGFIGPNGAGKSTTIRLMLNLLKKDAGTVRLLGMDSEKDELSIKQQVGFVLDGTYFHEALTIENVRWLVSGFYDKWEDKKFRLYLDKFKLKGDKKLKELSTGMKAKLNLAVALSHNAKLLILDEPTSGLDPVVRDDILSELFEVIRDEQKGVFLSSHITSDLEKIADYITFINDGRIILSQPKETLHENFAIVRGAKRQLPEIRRHLLRVRQTEFGFDALTSQPLLIKKEGVEGLIFEKPSIEDIMLYYIKGEAI